MLTGLQFPSPLEVRQHVRTYVRHNQAETSVDSEADCRCFRFQPLSRDLTDKGVSKRVKLRRVN